MKRLILIAAILALTILACGESATPASTIDVASIQTKVVGTALASVAQTATTAALSNTLLPTETALSTDTPIPSDTPTPAPQPIVFKGTTTDVVDVKKWDGPAILKIKYTGGGNFAIQNYDSSGSQIDLLVNTIGNYQGTVPLDFLDSESTTRLQITASGPWEIDILPINQIRQVNIPGTFTGTGDDIVSLIGGSPDLLKVDARTASSNFVVYSYGSSRSLAINEIAPYTGTVILESDVSLLSIQATGPWSIEVTTK